MLSRMCRNVDCWWEYKIVQPLRKTVWLMDPQEVNIKLLYDLAIPSLSIYPKELKGRTQTDICTPVFVEVLFITVLCTFF